jgi:hypothetical protein
MATLAGHEGYRPTERFLRNNEPQLRKLLPFSPHQLPSYVTLRAIFEALDFQALAQALRDWAAARLPEQELLAIDGKAIASTVTEHDTSAQDFAALVSAYGVSSGIVAAMEPYRNAQESEIVAVQRLIESLASVLVEPDEAGQSAGKSLLAGKTLTFDALHAQKKPSASSTQPEATTSSNSSATTLSSTRHA